MKFSFRFPSVAHTISTCMCDLIRVIEYGSDGVLTCLAHLNPDQPKLVRKALKRNKNMRFNEMPMSDSMNILIYVALLVATFPTFLVY